MNFEAEGSAVRGLAKLRQSSVFSATFIQSKTRRPDFAELLTLTAYLTTIDGVQSRYGNFKFQYRERTFGRGAARTK
jgi:hypothetical protein